MKLRWMAVAVLALMASACGGTVEESTDTQAQHANVDPVAGAGLHNGGGAEADENVIGVPCGSNTCGKGTYCCNASCGVCAPKGASCLDVMCEVAQQPQQPEAAAMKPLPPEEQQLGGSCGGNSCGAGTWCCNPSCGVCAPKGASCLDIAC
ncbi:hypothetical protein [Hyalangium gracile]|uniref:hypothetical protein n=1 Tax=Hyalangium gracile TaxID=394092 RepID=UPI001CD02AF7|nr:hypothetical protein [Hyalangium gracile]